MQMPTHLVGMQFTRTVFSFHSKDYAEEKMMLAQFNQSKVSLYHAGR